MDKVTLREHINGQWSVHVNGVQHAITDERGAFSYAQRFTAIATVEGITARNGRIDGQTIEEWRQEAEAYKRASHTNLDAWHKARAEANALRAERDALAKSDLNHESWLLRIAYALANRSDAGPQICAWLRDQYREINRPLADAIGRRMETAPDWPVPERHKLDNPDKATASDRRETISVSESTMNPGIVGFARPEDATIFRGSRSGKTQQAADKVRQMMEDGRIKLRESGRRLVEAIAALEPPKAWGATYMDERQGVTAEDMQAAVDSMNATAGDKRETGKAYRFLSQDVITEDSIGSLKRCHHMEGQSGLGCDCQACTCYQGLGFYGSNIDPACPVHGAK